MYKLDREGHWNKLDWILQTLTYNLSSFAFFITKQLTSLNRDVNHEQPF